MRDSGALWIMASRCSFRFIEHRHERACTRSTHTWHVCLIWQRLLLLAKCTCGAHPLLASPWWSISSDTNKRWHDWAVSTSLIPLSLQQLSVLFVSLHAYFTYRELWVMSVLWHFYFGVFLAQICCLQQPIFFLPLVPFILFYVTSVVHWMCCHSTMQPYQQQTEFFFQQIDKQGYEWPTNPPNPPHPYAFILTEIWAWMYVLRRRLHWKRLMRWNTVKSLLNLC